MAEKTGDGWIDEWMDRWKLEQTSFGVEEWPSTSSPTLLLKKEWERGRGWIINSKYFNRLHPSFLMRKVSVKQDLTAIERQSGKARWGGKCVYVEMGCLCVCVLAVWAIKWTLYLHVNWNLDSPPVVPESFGLHFWCVLKVMSNKTWRKACRKTLLRWASHFILERSRCSRLATSVGVIKV